MRLSVQGPGFVNTAWGSDMPWYIRMFVRAIQPLGRSIEDCGEAMCVPLFSPGSGLALVDKDGNSGLPTTSAHTPEARDFMWRHTQETLQRLGVRPLAPPAAGGAGAELKE